MTPPEGFEVVLHVDALKPGEVSEVIAGGTAICVANVEGSYHAVSNTCPTRTVRSERSATRTKVLCPYHGRRLM